MDRPMTAVEFRDQTDPTFPRSVDRILRHAWRPRAARFDPLRDQLGAMTPEGLAWFLAGEECTVCGLGRRGVEVAGLYACSGKQP